MRILYPTATKGLETLDVQLFDNENFITINGMKTIRHEHAWLKELVCVGDKVKILLPPPVGGVYIHMMSVGTISPTCIDAFVSSVHDEEEHTKIKIWIESIGQESDWLKWGTWELID